MLGDLLGVHIQHGLILGKYLYADIGGVFGGVGAFKDLNGILHRRQFEALGQFQLEIDDLGRGRLGGRSGGSRGGLSGGSGGLLRLGGCGGGFIGILTAGAQQSRNQQSGQNQMELLHNLAPFA